MKKSINIISIIIISFILISCGKSKSPTGGPKDLINPKIISISPNEFGDISEVKEIEIVFSKPISRSSVLANTYFYPPIYKKKFYWDKNILKIKINEELEIDKNYFITFSEKIKGEHDNNLDKQYVFTFKSGKLNESTLYGKIIHELEDDKDFPTIISFYTADSILVMKKNIQKEDYLFEMQNPGDYFIESYSDKNDNFKYDDEEPYFKEFFTLDENLDFPIELVYQDSIKPEMRKVETISNRELNVTFSENISELEDIKIYSADSLKIPLKINKFLIENDKMNIITEVQDSLKYEIFAFNTKDFKQNNADTLNISFNYKAERDSLPPVLKKSIPVTGTTVKELRPTIELFFDEIIFKDKFYAKLINSEKNEEIKYDVLNIDDKKVILRPKKNLENYNSYELKISRNTSDISKNYLLNEIGIKFIVIVNKDID